MNDAAETYVLHAVQGLMMIFVPGQETVLAQFCLQLTQITGLPLQEKLRQLFPLHIRSKGTPLSKLEYILQIVSAFEQVTFEAT